MWLFILIAGVFIWFAHQFRSIFWQILSGLLAIAAGVEFMTQSSEWPYIVFGVSIIAVGFYQWGLSILEVLRGED